MPYFETLLCPKCMYSVVIPSGRIEETGCSFCFQEEEGGGLSQCPADWTNTIMHLCFSTAAASTKGILCYNFTIQFKVFTSIQGYSIRKKCKNPQCLRCCCLHKNCQIRGHFVVFFKASISPIKYLTAFVAKKTTFDARWF